jgi:branched-chain amino acid transport system permease protein
MSEFFHGRPLRARVELVEPLLLLVVALAVLGGLGHATGGAFLDLVVRILIYTVLVVGLYIFVGNSGVLTFGHVAFAAVGGYTSGLLTVPLVQRRFLMPDVIPPFRTVELGATTSVLVAGVVAAVFAFLVGFPLMRLSGLAAGIASFAVLAGVRVVLLNWDGIAGSGGTLTGFPAEVAVLAAVAWAAMALVLAFAYQVWSSGLRLRATREDEAAARSIGIDPHRERHIAFTLSAFVMGVGGALFTQFLGNVNPNVFFLDLTFLTLAMLIVGGLRSLTGAVTGAVVLTSVSEVFRRLEEGTGVGPLQAHIPVGTTQVLVAVFMLVVLATRPAGITGGHEIAVLRAARRRIHRNAPPV